MTFLAPLLLLGVATVAVPVFLHLLRRQDRRTFVFPALRYLKRTTREHARIVRLRQLLLLALRISAVVVAALAAARLVLPIGGSDDPPAGVAIVVDNGLTSAAVVGQDRVLDSLAARALQVLGRAGPRDRIWVVPAGAPWEAAVPLSPAAAADAVRGLTSTHVTADLAESVGRAGSLLATANETIREVVVLSDLRPESVGSDAGGVSRPGPTVRIAPRPAVLEANRGIADIQVSGGLTPRAGDLAELQIRVTGSDPGEVEVRGYVGDDLIGSSMVGPAGSASILLPRLESGWVRGRVELEPDDLRADDVAYFAFQAIAPPTVGLSGTPPPFLQEALGVLEDAGRIVLTDAADAGVLIVVPPATGPLRAPGIVLVPASDPALVPVLNRSLGELVPGWSLRAEPEGDATELRVSGGEIADVLPGQLTVRSRYVIARPAGIEDVTTELLTLSDDSPWIVETESEGRRIVLLSSPLGVEASDLPTSASMLPLLDALIGRLADGEPTRSGLAGDPITAPRPATAVRLPDGTLRALDGTFAFAETGTIGIYEFVGPEGETISLTALNPLASVPGTNLDASEAASRLSSVWEQVDVAEPWPSAVLTDRRGREVAGPLLVLLFVILLSESWLAAAQGRSARGGGKDESAPRPPSTPLSDPSTSG